MRVLVNGLATAGTRTGIGHYTAEVVRAMQALKAEVVCHRPAWADYLKSWWSAFRSRVERPSSMLPATVGLPPRRTLRGSVLDFLRQAGLAWYAQGLRAEARRGYDLYHEPNFIPLDCPLPCVVTVADLSVLLHPYWHPADRVADFERRFRRGLSRAVHVLTISQHVREEIIRHLGVPPAAVSVTYCGIRPGLGPVPPEVTRARLAALGLPPSYLLHVGTIEPRKNLLTLLKAYCSLPAATRAKCPLVLAGGWGWNSSDVHEYLTSEALHRGVLQVGYVPEADLAAVYNGARALAFPTHYEGFGMPAAEMLACGGAVLSSTAGAVAEVLDGAGHLIDPLDVDGWREALRRVIEDDGWHASLCAGGPELARRYTWERCAEETLAGYRKALSAPARLAA
jgi:alpha-1,3-rhamnosyl/mannosyltransferase